MLSEYPLSTFSTPYNPLVIVAKPFITTDTGKIGSFFRL
jgi:hypothetical protein